MVTCEFSYQNLGKEREGFVAQTRAHIRQLKIQLKNTKKNGVMNDFLVEIKKVTDQLAMIGTEVSTNEYIEVIFDGLPEEYNSFKTSLLSRIDLYTIEEMESLLISNEERV